MRDGVFVKGSDNTLWQLWIDKEGNWRWNNQFGGKTITNVASAQTAGFGTHSFALSVASSGANRLDVFYVTAVDNSVQQLYWADDWHTFSGLGGKASSSPSALWWTYHGEKRIDVFVRGTDFALWQRFYPQDNLWSQWFGPRVFGPLSA